MTVPVATTSLDDPERLAAVDALELVGRESEERLDRVTRTAQRLLSAPMSFLNLLGPADLWVASCVGFGERSVDRDVAFCTHAIAAEAPLLVDDTTLDPRFAGNPLVVGGPRIRAYAGHPLRGPSGHVVGTLCVMDLQARSWSPADREALHDLAAWAQEELAQGEVARRLAAGDRLRRQHEQVLTHAGQGIVGIDAAGTVVLANPAATRLTGWQDQGLVGRPLHATLHPRDEQGRPCTTADCPIAEAASADGGVLRWRGRLWRRDDTELPVQLSCAPIAGPDGVTGAVLVFDDVSEQQAVDRMKDEFLSVVSHELRTPLTSLRGSLGLLAAGVLGELSPQGKQMADVAVSSTARLVRLVDDILDLERLVAGQVVLERRVHRLHDLARTAVDAVGDLAGAAGVEVRTEAVDETAWVDGDRVVQVLVNLVGNAVKFSAPGSVVELRADVRDGGVVLEVEDHGRGIPPEQLDRVFERFAQVDSSDSRDRGGSGLGLAIARNVVEAHGGHLRARSDVGRGTTFTAVLPQRRPGSGPRPAGRRAEDEQARG